jgi:hypothetical protein
MTATLSERNNILNYVFGSAAFSPANPGSYWIGLSTTLVTNAGLSSVTEPSGAAAYARVEIVNDTTSWTTSTNGLLKNKNQIDFPESTGSWGTILSVFLADAANAGHVFWYAPLVPTLIVQANTIVSFVANSITATST